MQSGPSQKAFAGPCFWRQTQCENKAKLTRGGASAAFQRTLTRRSAELGENNSGPGFDEHVFSSLMSISSAADGLCHRSLLFRVSASVFP